MLTVNWVEASARKGVARKVKRLRHWLCSSCQLLRGSQ